MVWGAESKERDCFAFCRQVRSLPLTFKLVLIIFLVDSHFRGPKVQISVEIDHFSAPFSTHGTHFFGTLICPCTCTIFMVRRKVAEVC